jgi:hypothetical protein
VDFAGRRAMFGRRAPAPRGGRAGKTETKTHLLSEGDELWESLRHLHLAAASLEITNHLDEFRAKNRAAKAVGSPGGTGELDVRGMKALVAALPMYRWALRLSGTALLAMAETNRMRLFLFCIQNRVLGPCLAAVRCTWDAHSSGVPWRHAKPWLVRAVEVSCP